MPMDVHCDRFGTYWRRFRHTLTTRNLRFARLFAPEGAGSANLFLVPRGFAEIPGILGGFPGDDPETIGP
jgi:hypothetical protein